MVGVSTDGVSVSLSFLMVVLTSCCFDWDFFVNGICCLRCKWDILIYRWCFALFFLLLFVPLHAALLSDVNAAIMGWLLLALQL
jgi:hypothetical protein